MLNKQMSVMDLCLLNMHGFQAKKERFVAVTSMRRTFRMNFKRQPDYVCSSGYVFYFKKCSLHSDTILLNLYSLEQIKLTLTQLHSHKKNPGMVHGISINS